MGPQLRDWALLVISLVFVAAGLVIVAARPQEAIGWTSVLFFGGCAAVAVWSLRAKRRAAQQAEDPTLLARFDAGAELRPDLRRLRAISGGLALFGGVVALVGRGLGSGFVLASLGLGLLGAGALAASLLGLTGRASLRCAPEGLWIGARAYRYRVAWDNVGGLDLGEVHSQPLLRIWVRDFEACSPPARPRPSARASPGRSGGAAGWSAATCRWRRAPSGSTRWCSSARWSATSRTPRRAPSWSRGGRWVPDREDRGQAPAGSGVGAAGGVDSRRWPTRTNLSPSARAS